MTGFLLVASGLRALAGTRLHRMVKVADAGGSSAGVAAQHVAHSFGGIKVSTPTRAEFLSLVHVHLRLRDQFLVTFINPDYARQAFRDDGLRARINAFDLVLVDGIGVQLMAPLFAFRVPARLDADSLAPHLLDALAAHGASLFLFGCAPGVADRAAARFVMAFPEVKIVGTQHGYWDMERGHPGYFDDSDTRRIAQQIRASRADVVLVSLPSPLQQTWVIDHREEISAPLVITCGSFLDHVADNDTWPASWYPAWADRLRLNWLVRLIREPRRLWRRYTIGSAQFGWLTLRARVAPSRGRVPLK